jgi:hypothetical protein
MRRFWAHGWWKILTRDLAIGIVLVGVGVGAGLALNSALDPTYRVATAYSSIPGLGFDGGRSGVLGGQTNQDGTACFWVGSGQDQAALVWPEGYSAHGNPLAISDAKGRVLATVGQYVALRGGNAPEGSKPPLGCPASAQQFLTAEVLQPDK